MKIRFRFLHSFKIVSGRMHNKTVEYPEPTLQFVTIKGYDSAGRFVEHYELIAGRYYFINDHPDNRYA